MFVLSHVSDIMASFFGEVVTGSYRYIDDEAPDYVGEVAGEWSAGEGIEKETGLLVVTEGDIAGSYSKLWGNLPAVGTLQCGSRQLPVNRLYLAPFKVETCTCYILQGCRVQPGAVSCWSSACRVC